jgi:hypothetical protein
MKERKKPTKKVGQKLNEQRGDIWRKNGRKGKRK